MMRNTDLDWKRIAEDQPYFGVISQPDFLRANLNEEALGTFWESGFNDIGWQVEVLRAHYGDFRPRTAIDFGCGVGRTTRAIAAICEYVYGVDIAPAMLEEARKSAPANITFGLEIPDVQVDWIHSLIVFQHIPPVRGVILLRELLRRLSPGGAVTVHFTLFKSQGALAQEAMGAKYFSWDGERARTFIEEPFPVGGMSMYDYDLGQLIAILHEGGINRVTLQHTDHGGHHGAVIIGRK
jgi:SAM-dependent methyltransferase